MAKSEAMSQSSLYDFTSTPGPSGQKSDGAREAVLKRSYRKQPSVAVQLHNQGMQDQKLNREMLIKQLSSLRYLLRQGLALRGHDEKQGNLCSYFCYSPVIALG